MEIRELKALLALMREHGLSELEIEDKKGKVRLVCPAGGGGHPASPAAAIAAQPSPTGSAAPAKGPGKLARSAISAPAPVGTLELQPNQKLIESPMVGTFYRASAPDAAPLVEEGTHVRKGQALCIIEAMKMMNEIETDMDGRVVRVLAENGQPVEYGQPLMVLEIS